MITPKEWGEVHDVVSGQKRERLAKCLTYNSVSLSFHEFPSGYKVKGFPWTVRKTSENYCCLVFRNLGIRIFYSNWCVPVSIKFDYI